MNDLVLIVILYMLPLAFCCKRGYDDEEGAWIVVGLLPIANLIFASILFVMEGSEWVIRKIKGY